MAYVLLNEIISNLSKVNKTRDSRLQFLLAGCPGLSGLSPSILSQFTLKMCTAAENRKKHWNSLFEEYKVTQGHRYWHH